MKINFLNEFGFETYSSSFNSVSKPLPFFSKNIFQKYLKYPTNHKQENGGSACNRNEQRRSEYW